MSTPRVFKWAGVVLLLVVCGVVFGWVPYWFGGLATIRRFQYNDRANKGLTPVVNVLRTIRDERDVDFYTTGRDYSANVLDRAGFFQTHGWK